ncbi:MAG: hypothetical protein Kow0029_27270 [Candidatus Rifleibacteriota bacterium]
MENQKSEIVADEFHTLKLEPMPHWKWLAAILLLMGFPLAILFEQMISSFQAVKDEKTEKIQLEVEKLVGRAASEMATDNQIYQILEEFESLISDSLARTEILKRTNPYFSLIPFLSADRLKRLLLNHERIRIVSYERRLKQIIPGIRLLKWDNRFRVLKSSDRIVPRIIYSKLLNSIIGRLKQRQKPANTSYVKDLPDVQRFFKLDPNLVDFVKYGDGVHKFTTAAGLTQYMYWNNEWLTSESEVDIACGGFLAVVDENRLPATFGIQKFFDRKSHEWRNSGYALGWINAQDPATSYLPFPFSVIDKDFWIKWIGLQPNGLYQKKDLILSIRRVNASLTLVAAKEAGFLEDQLEKNIFWLVFSFAVTLIVILFIVAGYKKNDGIAMSIKWQILGLFLLTMILPSVALTHLGAQLHEKKKESYENQAFKKLERFKKDIEENKPFFFDYLVGVGEDFTIDLMKKYHSDEKKPFREDEVGSLIEKYSERVRAKHLYLFNAAGKEILGFRSDSSERNNLLPLVTSLAKLKLRLNGKLVEEGYAGAVSLMDLMIEETGGASLADIQTFLKTKKSSAFELKFSDRRTYIFIGEFSPPDESDKVFILVFILKDRNFDQMYLDLMIKKFEQEKKTGRTMQVFYGEDSADRDSYFTNGNISNPFFEFYKINKDSIGIGKLTEPTRFAGISVKNSYVFENGRKVLLYSFKCAGVDGLSVMALYDYSEIAEKLRMLRVLVVIVLLVTLLVIYILVRITARSLIDPISVLKQAVNEIEQGHYSVRVEIPGEDELVDLSLAFNAMSKGLDEREKMTRYLFRSAVEAVKKGKGSELGGKRVPATILFSDIRSFTTISESNDAETVVGLLNDYFAKMTRVIEEHDGDIDKFIGDAIMALFISDEEKGRKPDMMALKAVKCALNMMETLKKFNSERKKQGKFPIMIGVGINSGEVIAGNIGSPGRMDHTVIGDVVNVASRLEGMSKLGKFTHVIISKETLELVKDHIEYEQLKETSVKGKTSAVQMFEVISCR